MASLIEWKVPQSVQPRAEEYSYDLERALSSVVGLHSIVPPDAFTADTLGIERAGNGVLVDDGLVLTIGYLITEAETVWVHLGDGRVVQGHALGFDQETGFGLVQTLGKIDPPGARRGGLRAARKSANGSLSAELAAARARLPGASPQSRNSPAIGSTCSRKRSLPTRHIQTGAARR